jgi:hypothetical protein
MKGDGSLEGRETTVNFRRLVALEVIAGAIGTAIVVLLVDKVRIHPFWLLLLIFLAIVVTQSPFLRLRMQVFRSGVRSFYMRFPVTEGPLYWTRARSELVYWGVTGGSISSVLRTVLTRDASSKRKYRFLLMSSTGSGLREQVAFMMATTPGVIDSQASIAIGEELDASATRLTATLAMLKNTPAFRDGRLEVRLFDEFLPWWVYILDGQEMVVGILQSGQDVGEQPAAVLRKHSSQCTLFDAFHENFERVWGKAKCVGAPATSV